MGAVAGKAAKMAVKVWEKARPEQCTAIYRQKKKVLKKFDRVIRVLNMNPRDASDFYMLFVEIDVDFSGDVDIWEFADYYEVVLSLFIERLFKKLDNHDKGGLFFGEYLFSIWNLCTLTPKELVLFVFTLYDEAGTGLLPQDMMRKVVEEMYELDMRVDERVPSFLLRNIDQLYYHKKFRGQAPFVTVEQFARFAEKYNEFMAPALALQAEVEKRSLTPEFWWQMKRERVQLNISMDPHLFEMYLRDISDLGNEKGVLRPGGDEDSDLEEESEDDDDDSSGSSGDDDDKGDDTVVALKPINRRELRKRVVRSDPKWERTIRGGVVESKADPAPSEDEESEDGGDGDEGGDGGSAASGGSPPPPKSPTPGPETDSPSLFQGLEVDTSPPVRSPSGVGPLFEPGSATSPAGLVKPTSTKHAQVAPMPSPVKPRLGKRKIKVPKDPKWEPRRMAH